MAVTNNRRISELTPASEVNKEDLVVIVQNGETKNAPKRLVSEENYTSTEKTKLAGIEEGANNYVLPDDVVHTNQINDVVREEELNQKLTSYSLKTETGAQVEIVFNASTYVMSIQLLDGEGNLIYESSEIDLPLETMVVDGEYDAATKEIVLTLDSGSTVRFSVSDLVSGLVSETQLAQTLAAYAKTTYVDGKISAVNVTISALSDKVDNIIVISNDENDATSDTEIFINPDEVNSMGTEVVNSLDGNETNMSPSVRAVKEKVSAIDTRVNKLETYSTEETVVGTWMGKPLYKKTINFGSFPNATTTRIPHGISNIEMVPFYLYGWYDSDDKRWLSNGRVGANNVLCLVTISSTYIILEGGSINWTNRTSNGNVTIYYTKTTD